jgi:uncharacterized membrane protein YdjX (TVP38/TMEM64 family)
MAKPLQDRSSQLRVAFAVGVMALIVSLGQVLPIGRWTLLLSERIRGTGFEGGLIFIAVYVVAEAALVRGSLLTMAAGFAYGPVTGLLIASPASVLAVTMAFARSRWRGGRYA